MKAYREFGVVFLLASGLGAARPAGAQSVPACSPAPLFGCRTPTESQRGALVVHAVQPRVTWKWRNGDKTAVSDFGDPLTTTGYRLCVYDTAGGIPTPVLSASAPAGGTCGAGDCWRQRSSGFRFTNNATTADGLVKIVLHAGDPGRASMTVKARGTHLALPPLPLHQDAVVVAQLVNTTGECWEAQYHAAPVRNDGTCFKAKPDAGPVRYGVMASRGQRPETIADVTALGGAWMRLNAPLDQPLPAFQSFLDAGQNLIITVVNRDPTNIDTGYGSPSTYDKAGFPFLDEAAYKARITDLLTPLFPAIAAGRQVWLQCENEIGDASLATDSQYWRGTTDQYLATLAAMTAAVRAASPSVPVVLSGFTSNGLDRAIHPLNPGDPGYGNYFYATRLLERLLTEGTYDAADLHFYGCFEDIAAKVQWVKDNGLLTGRRWISTENAGPDFETCADTPTSWRDDLAGFEATQAEQVTQRLRACADNGGSVCLWFSLYDLVNEVDRFNHLGLLDPRVLPPAPKPAYSTFQSFAATHH